jgi:hypothetical protein
VWWQLQFFPKLNHQVFLSYFFLLINLAFFLWSCLWSLCVFFLVCDNCFNNNCSQFHKNFKLQVNCFIYLMILHVFMSFAL